MLELFGLLCIPAYLAVVVGPAAVTAGYAIKRSEKTAGLVIAAAVAAFVGGVIASFIPFQATGWATDMYGLASLPSLLMLIGALVCFLISKGASPSSVVAGGLASAPLGAAVVWLVRVCSRFFSA